MGDGGKRGEGRERMKEGRKKEEGGGEGKREE